MNAGRIGIVGDVRRDGGRVPLEAQSKADWSIPGHTWSRMRISPTLFATAARWKSHLSTAAVRSRHRAESVYKWELDKGDESLVIAVNGSLLLDELDLVIQAALDGAGLAWVAEDRVAEHLGSGALVRVLKTGVRRFQGSSCTTQAVTAALSGLIDTLRF